jgi:succinate dehydrogenase/fumarate reductase flavoprotein subunit
MKEGRSSTDGAFYRRNQTYLEIASSILSETENNVRAFQQKFSLLMSKFAGPVRNVDAMQQLLRQVEEFISHFSERVRTNPENLGRAFTLYETLQTQRFYLHSYIDYAINKRNSRGSSLYYQSEGTLPYTYLEDEFRCIIHNGSETQTQLIGIENGTIKCKWREVRSIPNEPQFFESVWASYRDNNNVY